MKMRQWAGPIGFLGSAASLVFWVVVPYVGSADLSRTGEAIGVVFAVLPAIGALLVPGLLVSVATLLALQPVEAPVTGRGEVGGRR